MLPGAQLIMRTTTRPILAGVTVVAISVCPTTCHSAANAEPPSSVPRPREPRAQPALLAEGDPLSAGRVAFGCCNGWFGARIRDAF